MTTSGHCPREDGAQLVEGCGALGEAACPTCQGRFFVADIAESLFAELGAERATLVDLVEGTHGRPLPCAECGQKLRPLVLRDVNAHLCLGCGSLWLDEGGLHELSEGHHREVRATVPVAERPGRNTALLLEEREVDPDTLVQAVLGTRLTGVDVRPVALRKEGIVSLYLSVDDATLIQERLATRGVASHMLSALDLNLPKPHDVLRLRPHAEALACVDSAGRQIDVAWDDVSTVAVGRYPESTASWRSANKGVSQPARVGRSRGPIAGAMRMAQMAYVGPPSSSPGRDPKADEHEQLWVITREPRRTFRLRLRTALFDEPSEGPRKPLLFRRLVDELVERAPAAVKTRATADFLADEEATVTRFGNEVAFERDLLWTAWHAALP